MKPTFLIAAALGTLLCLIGTAVGFSKLLSASGVLGYTLCIGLAVMSVLLLLNSRGVIRREDSFHAFMQVPWGLAVLGVGTALMVTMFRVFLGDLIQSDSMFDVGRAALFACFAIFLLTGSPIVVSYLIPVLFADDEADDEPARVPEDGQADD